MSFLRMESFYDIDEYGELSVMTEPSHYMFIDREIKEEVEEIEEIEEVQEQQAIPAEEEITDGMITRSGYVLQKKQAQKAKVVAAPKEQMPLDGTTVLCHRCRAAMRLCNRRLKYGNTVKEYPSYRCTRKGCQTFKSVRVLNNPNYVPSRIKERRPKQTLKTILQPIMNPYAVAAMSAASAAAAAVKKVEKREEGLRLKEANNRRLNIERMLLMHMEEQSAQQNEAIMIPPLHSPLQQAEVTYSPFYSGSICSIPLSHSSASTHGVETSDQNLNFESPPVSSSDEESIFSHSSEPSDQSFNLPMQEQHSTVIRDEFLSSQSNLSRIEMEALRHLSSAARTLAAINTVNRCSASIDASNNGMALDSPLETSISDECCLNGSPPSLLSNDWPSNVSSQLFHHTPPSINHFEDIHSTLQGPDLFTNDNSFSFALSPLSLDDELSMGFSNNIPEL